MYKLVNMRSMWMKEENILTSDGRKKIFKLNNHQIFCAINICLCSRKLSVFKIFLFFSKETSISISICNFCCFLPKYYVISLYGAILCTIGWLIFFNILCPLYAVFILCLPYTKFVLCSCYTKSILSQRCAIIGAKPWQVNFSIYCIIVVPNTFEILLNISLLLNVCKKLPQDLILSSQVSNKRL